MNENEIKLSIELVPATCWYSNVRSNVRPSTWDRLQQEVFQAANYRCQICGGTGPAHPVEAHEIWSYDDHRMVQTLKDLISLCPNCHEVKHIGHALKSGRTKRVIEWLCLVNHFDADQALAYIDYSFKVHGIRSQFQWRLDLSVLVSKYRLKLDKHGIEQGLNQPR